MRIFWILIIFTAGWAQTASYIHDARSLGMAGANVADIHSAMPAFTNPAVLTRQSDIRLHANATSPYSEFEIFQIGAIGFSYEMPKWGTVAVSAEFFNVEWDNHVLMQEASYALSHGFELMKDLSTSLSLGYNIRLFQLTYNNFEGTGATQETTEALFDFGIMATLYDRLYFGAFLKNVGNTKVGLEHDQELLREMQVGIAYNPYPGVWTNFDLSKEIGYDNRYHFGVDYEVFNENDVMFDVHIGFVSNPNQFAYGFELGFDGYSVLYGAMTHPIAVTHQFGLGIQL